MTGVDVQDKFEHRRGIIRWYLSSTIFNILTVGASWRLADMSYCSHD